MFPSTAQRRRIDQLRAAAEHIDDDSEEWITVVMINDPEARRGRGNGIKPPTGPEDYARYQAECKAHPDPDTVRTIRIRVRPPE
jgi:hypothetical protein